LEGHTPSPQPPWENHSSSTTFLNIACPQRSFGWRHVMGAYFLALRQHKLRCTGGPLDNCLLPYHSMHAHCWRLPIDSNSRVCIRQHQRSRQEAAFGQCGTTTACQDARPSPVPRGSVTGGDAAPCQLCALRAARLPRHTCMHAFQMAARPTPHMLAWRASSGPGSLCSLACEGWACPWVQEAAGMNKAPRCPAWVP
jgi:hypothetical protein